MRYFTLKEMTSTSTGLPNEPDEVSVRNLEYLVNNLLDPVREKWGRAIRINSGFRTDAVNRAVGSTAKSSQHLTGCAADITAGSAAENRKLFEMIRESRLVFDQLIDEKDYSWIHVSLVRVGNRKNVLHLK